MDEVYQAPSTSIVPEPDGTFTMSVEGDDREIMLIYQNRTLCLSNLKISDRELENLLNCAIAYSLNTHVVTILLSNNRLTSYGMKYLCSTLNHSFPSLIELDLNNNLGDKGVEWLYSYVKQRAKKDMCPLSVLNLSKTSITTEGAHMLHKLIRKGRGSTHVDFSNNQINGEGVGYLFSARYWESFTIDNNTLDVTYLFFAKHIRNHSHMLKELRILHNNISPTVVAELPRIVSSLALPSLRVLYVGERLWDKGVCELLEPSSLEKLANLEFLTLADTELVCDGFVAFLRAFERQCFPHLKELCIQEENCLHAVFSCCSAKSRNNLVKIDFKGLSDVNYNLLLAAAFTVPTIHSLAITCVSEEGVFATLYDAICKGFLAELDELELQNVTIPFRYVKDDCFYVLPTLKSIVLDGTKSPAHYTPLAVEAQPIEHFRGVLFDQNSHHTATHSRDIRAESFTYYNGDLCDLIFTYLLKYAIGIIKHIDIRNNPVSDHGIRFCLQNYSDEALAYSEVLYDTANVSPYLQMLFESKQHPEDEEIKKEIEIYEKEHRIAKVCEMREILKDSVKGKMDEKKKEIYDDIGNYEKTEGGCCSCM